MLDHLKATLLELAQETTQEEIQLIIGGGLGLFLKQEQLHGSGTRTLFQQELPQPRATNDIDLFVGLEVITQLDKFERLAECIRGLGFEAIKGREFLQWKRTREEREVKLDLLTGPLGDRRDEVKVNAHRIRPHGRSVGLHAHLTTEAVGLDQYAQPLSAAGQIYGGAVVTVQVLVPHPFTYLLMKFHAFADRYQDEQKDVGRHHAMDLYRIVGMLTQDELKTVRELAVRYQQDAAFQRTQQIVQDHFSSETSPGLLRLREHKDFTQKFRVQDFIKLLRELFLPSQD